MIIGICGGSASGKTTFTQKILQNVNPEYLIHIEHDSYYRDIDMLPPHLQENLNFDHPDSLDNQLFAKHLKMLQNNKPINRPIYDFTIQKRIKSTKIIEPKPIIVVEGILIFAEEELRDIFDIKVFIDTDSDLRLSRRLTRDINDRGRTPDSVIAQYLKTVRPMHNQFVEPSKQHSDLIISGNTNNYVGLDLLVTKVNAHIRELKKR
jgi:uridine kinase